MGSAVRALRGCLAGRSGVHLALVARLPHLGDCFPAGDGRGVMCGRIRGCPEC